MDRCPVGRLDRATALTNFAWARLIGYIRNDLQDDITISLFHEALVLRPQRNPDHLLSLHILTKALTWRHKKKNTAADIHEAVQLYHELLPLCPEGTSLRSIAAGENGVDYVIDQCISLPTDASDEGIHFRRVVLELCPLGHQLRPGALSSVLCSRFTQTQDNEDVEEAIALCQASSAALSSLHPVRYFSYIMMWLQHAYLARYQILHDPADLPLAIENFKLASRHPTQRDH
jgi:hypothetical protein